jgi:hypothetical protein
MESEHSTDFLREVLVHEFVHHLQYNKDHPDQYLPVSEKRDPTPCSQESEVFQAYWESPIEQEARYYESHPRKFDILVQKHGYSPLEWESVEVTLPILPSLVATVAVIATVAVGVFSYTLGEKVGILKGDNQFLRKENYELIQKLDKHDPCAYISSAEEKENCNLR